jgi:nitrogenase molybdenum-iron protein NifN
MSDKTSAAPRPQVAAADYEVTKNSCVVCAPLGATLAFAGVRKGMTILHGSQGCATYIRRYTISHFREPLDAASSSFTEESAVFGGKANLRLAFENVAQEYRPEFIGVATTCLAETIGEDAAATKQALRDLAEEKGVLLATVSTPSYRGDHRLGFRLALRAIAQAACPADASHADAPKPFPARGGETAAPTPVAVFPSLLSPADLRHLKGLVRAFGLEPILVSDYSDTLDGGPWKEHRLLPEGGTPIADLRRLPTAARSLELGSPVADECSGAAYLEAAFGVPRETIPLPIGVRPSDRLIQALEGLSGRPAPEKIRSQRERLLDSYVDAHKHVFGKRALLYGDPDVRDALLGFLAEIGMESVLAEGEGRDFRSVEEAAERSAQGGKPVDMLIGNSKGYKTAKRLGVPLVRVGFPIHDRFGGQRVRLLGYGGTQELFDRVVNAFIERKQEDSDVGYTYY